MKKRLASLALLLILCLVTGIAAFAGAEDYSVKVTAPAGAPALALATRFLNVNANRLSVRTAKEATYEVRRDLFHAALGLSGAQMDGIGLPSLISRMTSDSYNVQSFIQSSHCTEPFGISARFVWYQL